VTIPYYLGLFGGNKDATKCVINQIFGVEKTKPGGTKIYELEN